MFHEPAKLTVITLLDALCLYVMSARPVQVLGSQTLSVTTDGWSCAPEHDFTFSEFPSRSHSRA